MKILHCSDNRADDTKVFVQTKDGKFKYQLFMDYAKGLPEQYEVVPYCGEISSGCCDKDDNLYCGVRSGGPLDPSVRECLIKLDPDGNYIDAIGAGVVNGLHFFCSTDTGTMAFMSTPGSYVYETDADCTKVLKICGEPFENSDTGRDSGLFTKIRMHNGMFATEQSHGYFGGTFSMSLEHESMHMTGPFNHPNGIAQDSKGNFFISDGYGNVAVHKFDRDWNLIKSWGGKGVWDPYIDTPGKFIVPHGVCCDPNDNVWVCDRDKDALHIFDNDGNLLAYYSHNLGQPSGVDTDGQYVYVVGRGGYLTIFDLEFNVIGELGIFNGNLRAHGLAADSKGNLYLFPTHANFEHQIIALKRIADCN